MSEVSFLRDLSFVWLSALVVGFLFRQIKQPMLTGYILAGLLIGPYCLGLITSKNHVADLAELGVALLLFALGVELSLKQIFSANKKVFLVGIAQVAITVLVGYFASLAFGLTANPASAMLFGSICALSSTVVVTRILGEKGELNTLYGSIMVGVLIVQDLALVPMISLVTALNSGSDNLLIGLLIAFLKAALLIGIVTFGATKLVPKFLGYAAKTKSKELFQLAVMSVCLLTAILSNSLGMSVELGAFLAGIMVSESIYGYQALADIHPMKDLFSIVFFVTVGMLINPQFVTTEWSLILGFVIMLIVCKSIIAAMCTRIAVGSNRVAILVGLGLAQIGEFSFVLAMLGKTMNLIESRLYDLYISASVITLIISPFILAIAPKLLSTNREAQALGEKKAKSEEKVDLENHLIMCGFGTVGHSIAHVMQQYSIPFVVIESNAAHLDELDESGLRYIYGDATNTMILEKAGIEKAKTLVVSVRDHLSAGTIINTALEKNEAIKIVSRARNQKEAEYVKSAGAHAVIQAEFETSIEFTKQTLMGLGINVEEIKEVLTSLEERRYSILEAASNEEEVARALPFPQGEYLTVWVRVNDESISNKSIQQIDFRGNTGCTIVAVRRGSENVPYPAPSFVLQHGDELCVVGSTGQIESISDNFDMATFTPVMTG